MKLVGYPYLIELLNLHVLPVSLLKLEDEITLEDTVVAHLEFALQYEGINLEVIDAVFEHIQSSELIDHLKKNPNGEYIRRLCFLWEWLGYKELNSGISSSGKYIDLFPRQKYLTASQVSQNHTYRINNNALGTASFCPIVKRNALAADSPTLDELLEQAHIMLEESSSEAIYDYLYLSETRSSFAIEKETPSAQKEERFIRLLHRVWEYPKLTEDALVELQNANARTYRFFNADKEVRFLQKMLQQAIEVEMPKEVAWLNGYDKAFMDQL